MALWAIQMSDHSKSLMFVVLGRHQRAMQNAVTFECPMDSSDIYQLLYLVQLGSSKSGNYTCINEANIIFRMYAGL
jgi:hypothetical protein